ncbi:MAG: creatininase family protein [Burkholderiales bacterium]|nr:creatininase family protein [Burkholderiales bacterium]
MLPASWRACAWIVLLAGATLASAPLAAPSASVFLEDLTSPELAQRIAGGATTILVPIGGTEQNGAHMTLGKHNVRARRLAERIARELGNALVAPVIAYVPEGALTPPTGHMRHPGTITVPADAYRKVLESAARSFKLAGFRDIVFLGDHGDYQRDDQAVAAALDREWAASPVRVHALGAYYRGASTAFAESLRKQGYALHEIGTHAGLADTSLMLAVDPSQVRTERLHDKPAPGVTGDPARASAALGQAAVDAIVAQSAAAIRAATVR